MTETSFDGVEAQPAVGVPYDREAMPVSQWSLDIHDALKDWPTGFSVKWEWWKPGYLVLTITDSAQGPVEPVWIDTSNEELTVSFGMWEAHLPTHEMPVEQELVLAVAEVKRVTEDWFASRLLTVVYFDAAGKWCGSLTSPPDELDVRLADGVSWISDFGPKRAEVRSARRDRWRFFSIGSDNRLEEQISG